MDSTVERAYFPELNVPTFSDTALRQLVRELRGHGFNVYLTLSFEAHEALDAERPVGRYQLGDQTTGRATIFTAGRPVHLPDHRDGWRWEPYAVDGTDVEAARQQLQRLMRDAEADIAEALSNAGWLTVLDGPLHGIRHRRGLAIIGYVKTHRPSRDAVRRSAAPPRPRRPTKPRAGCRVSRQVHRDARAPVNLTPIAGLERHLHRRQDDARLALRTVREAVLERNRERTDGMNSTTTGRTGGLQREALLVAGALSGSRCSAGPRRSGVYCRSRGSTWRAEWRSTIGPWLRLIRSSAVANTHADPFPSSEAASTRRTSSTSRDNAAAMASGSCPRP